MSYDSEPAWASIDLSEIPSRCPKCNQCFGNFEETVECLVESSYYSPRHIPPNLSFMCFNEDCELYGEELEYELKVQVTASLKKKIES